MRYISSSKAQFDTGTYNASETDSNNIMHLVIRNLLENSSFRFDDDPVNTVQRIDGLGWKWWIYKKGGNSDPHTQVIEYADGFRSQKIGATLNTGYNVYLGQTIKPVPYNTDYTFSCDVKIDNPSNVKVQVIAELWSNGTYVKQVTSTTSQSTNFIKLSITFNTSSNVDEIRTIIMLVPVYVGATGAMWVANPQLELGSVPTAYVERYGSGYGEYVSSPISLADYSGFDPNPHRLEITASIPPSTNIKLQTRSANTIQDLQIAPWYGTDGLNGYYYTIAESPELLQNGTLIQDCGLYPCETRTNKYGTNDAIFNIVNDPDKSLKVEINSFTDGGARWEYIYSGVIEKNTKYKLSVNHKEDNRVTKAQMYISSGKADGSTVWGIYNSVIPISTTWRNDSILFRTQSHDAIKLYLSLLLNSSGIVETNNYSLKKISTYKTWQINPIHYADVYIQYRIVFETTDSYYSPLLYDVRIDYDVSIPEIKDLEIVSNNQTKYSLTPGETVTVNFKVVDYTGAWIIDFAYIGLYDTSGAELLSDVMFTYTTIDEITLLYQYTFTVPPIPTPDTFELVVGANNLMGETYGESHFIKIKPYLELTAQKMDIGILAWDYGLFHYDPPTGTIDVYKRYTGVDFWKLGISWDKLEPRRGEYDPIYINAILTFLNEAQASGVKVQFGIAQQWYPAWANNGKWDNGNRYYDYELNQYYTDTWVYLVNLIKNYPALDSYLICNEENYVFDGDVYIKSMNKVISAIRNADRNYNHRITIRPNAISSITRTKIGTFGNQDYDYGTGAYPTHWSYWRDHYANPLSNTSYLGMVQLRNSPIIFNDKAGIGEIGFYKGMLDTFGDQEKLIAFERAMSIAYDMGFQEFMMWGTGFAFELPETYFPLLKNFRDSLLIKPRISVFNVRILIDTGDWLVKGTMTDTSPELDMKQEPYYHLIRTLEENGYSWYYTHPDAENLQPLVYETTIRTSEIKGKTEPEQDIVIQSRLTGIIPNGTVYYWECLPDPACNLSVD